MASLKDIKRHIKAVKQTQKLTRAMNMVAASKLRQTQNRAERFRYYADEHERLIQEIAKRSPEDACSLLSSSKSEKSGTAKKALILAISSDRGLCGSFNSNIFSAVDKANVSLLQEGFDPEFFLIGRKARDYYQRRRVVIHNKMVDALNSFDYVLAKAIADDLIEDFLSGRYQEIWLIYTRFYSLNKLVVEYDRFLPLGPEPEKGASAVPEALDYLVEPSAQTLMERLIPRSLAILVYRAMLESVTSENAARMQAMDNASKSCKDIIESLTMAYNKARQAAVTSELLDIVNGAEALKG
ncbi:MAG: ATP synthase F1 subunit gamma [Deltaproteobacteria bacterium]|jgi:F-type H+-transporting ATPase subunit gamma|nr:ATP synthase F1 subunit gamma [Deltaproteobacteria bacterium]